MVVQKRQSAASNADFVVPPAAPSRSSSSTATPKAAKRASVGPPSGSKLRDSVVLPDRDAREPIVPQIRSSVGGPGPFSDDVVFLPSPQKTAKASPTKKQVKAKPSKVKAKQNKRKKQKQMTRLLNLLAQIVFLLFTIYSLLVCPKDANLESPVCRGLMQYRERILDPYILPPIKATLAHPVVAPQIARAKPYVNRALEVVQVQYDRAEVASRPYVVLATKEYNRRLRPHVRLMEYNLRKYRRQAQPYVDRSMTTFNSLWTKAEPYILPVLLKIQEAPLLAKDFIAKPLEQAKEKWVDPQLKKIVDKVEEMSASAGDAKGKEETATPVTYYSSPASSEPTTVDAPAPTPPEDVAQTAFEASETAVPEASPTYTDPLDVPVFNPNYEKDVEDLEFWEEFDAFLHDSVFPPDGTTSMDGAPQPTRLTDEEKAEKKRQEKLETAEKRKSITARHDKWEEELEALIKAKFESLRTFLEENRDKARKDLSDNEGTWKLISALKNELGQAVVGTEKVLEQLEATKSDRDATDRWLEKVPIWAKVLEQEERRFDGKVLQVQNELAAWVKVWVEAESAVVARESKEIMDLAEKASKDLLFDYAGLRDITYRDWERYHSILARARAVEEEMRQLFNGKHPATLSEADNPVHDELSRIQGEISQINEEFKEGLDEIRRKGWIMIMEGQGRKESEGAGWARSKKPQRTFKNLDVDEDGDEDGNIYPPGDVKKDQFRILPIDVDEDGKPIGDGRGRPEESGGFDNIPGGGHIRIDNLAREAVLSKDEEQIRQAVRMAEEARSREDL